MLVRPVHSAKSPEPRRHKSEGRLTGLRLFADPQHLWWCRINSCCDCCSCKVAGSFAVDVGCCCCYSCSYYYLYSYFCSVFIR